MHIDITLSYLANKSLDQDRPPSPPIEGSEVIDASLSWLQLALNLRS